jgi:hypothetical protein
MSYEQLELNLEPLSVQLELDLQPPKETKENNMAKKYRVFIVQTMQPLTVEADSEREAEAYAREHCVWEPQSTKFAASQVFYGDKEKDHEEGS